MTEAAATEPKLTDAFEVKLVPVIVTVVPPEIGPEFGLSEEIVGGATKV